MGNGPYTVQRIRFQLPSPTSQPSNQLGGGASFEVATGVQFELLPTPFNGSPIDASQIASLTFAVKPSSNEDAAAIISATVTPQSSGWNSNPVLTAGADCVPSYATYAA